MRSSILVITLLCSSIALAQPQARDQYRRAASLYDLGRYAEAAKGFEDVYVLQDDPALLFDAGQAHRLAGNLASAVRSYRAYLRRAPTAPEAMTIDAWTAEAAAGKKPGTVMPEALREPAWPPGAPPPSTSAPPPAPPPPPPAPPPPPPPPPAPPPAAASAPAPPASSGTVYDPWSARRGGAPPPPAQYTPPAPQNASPASPYPPPTATTSPAAPSAPTVVAPAPKPVDTTPTYKKWWVWFTIGIVAVGVASIGVGIAYSIPDNASSGLQTYSVSF